MRMIAAALSLALVLPAMTVSARNLPAEDEALLSAIELTRDQLIPLALETLIAENGEARAVICHADEPAWRDAAAVVQKAVADATGVQLRMVTDAELSQDDCDATNAILMGHLDNNRHVARLYHNFFVCLDQGFTGREGYVIRSVHDPWGLDHNYIVVGGSFPEGTALGAAAFAELVAAQAEGNSLTLGRLMDLQFDETDRMEPRLPTITDELRDREIEAGRKQFASAGQGRSGVARLYRAGQKYHHSGDPGQLEIYKGLMAAIVEYYETDKYINSDGLARYDRDFRDAWTFQVGILWDLIEESGAFTDDERLTYTNYCLRIAYECVRYQRYFREDIIEKWRTNDDIVHNHNTFPGLGIYFVGNYLKRHYDADFVDDWLTCAHGIFRGQRHSSKPLEDAASYQWLPIIHTMVYSLAEGDTTFFDEGHARETARVGMMVMDNAGWESAFGDHSGYRGASALQTTLNKIAWYYKDPEILWTSHHAAGGEYDPLGQRYHCGFAAEPARGHVGAITSPLPRKCYDYAERSPAYRTAPNLPWEESFDKLAFRAGLGAADEYMLLDGFGRGTHMHFDANAIIRYAAGGEPLLVDGEYIKNAPKYHNSMVIIRDGAAELTPAVTGLRYADTLASCSFSSTYLTDYNGTEWKRNIVWLPGDYMVVVDEVEALEAGDYTLRCCWRPWGDATLEGGRMSVQHPPMRLVIDNPDSSVSSRVETMKISEGMPISRLSQQVSRTLDVGESHRFVNLLYSDPADTTRELHLQASETTGVFTVTGPDGSTALIPRQTEPLANGALLLDADLVLVGPTRLAASGCTLIGGAELLLKATRPVSMELLPSEGRGALIASDVTSVELRVSPNSGLRVGDLRVMADAMGVASFEVPAGRYEIIAEPFALPAALAALADVQSADDAGPIAGDGRPDGTLDVAWAKSAFDPAAQLLEVESVTCDEEHSGRYGPVSKLDDGEFAGSFNSVQWPVGVTPTIVMDLGGEREISSVVTREWRMNESWNVAERGLEVSSDGFVNDVRTVDAPFENIGTESWGNNVNTLFEITVGQKARQIRLVATPAPEASVYLAEVEIRGLLPGAVPNIRAMATGDLTGDGALDVVLASDAGQVRAFNAAGDVLWTWAGDRSALNDIACADVDGDGRAEVIYGGDAARLGLLSADGEELWAVNPPQFRGIKSDVMTVLPADVDGDGLPEVIAGCKSWQYFAYDAAGEMVWENVIYAHSATVGYAADFDGDGKDEIIGGNAYYTLNLIDHDGKRIFNAGHLGPEQTAVSSADIDGDGTPEILVGVDHGELRCYGMDREVRWSANLGDKVTRITPLTINGELLIVCAAESANIYALDAAGQSVWRTPLADGSSDLVVADVGGEQILCAAAGSAGVYLLNMDGEVVGGASTDNPALAVAVVGSRLMVTTAGGQVQSFDLR